MKAIYLLKLVLVFLLCINLVKNDDEESSQLSEGKALEEIIANSNVLELVDTHIYSNGKLVAICRIEFNTMVNSIKTLAALGTDLDTYEIPHRGAPLAGCIIKDEDLAKNILQKVGEGQYIIPYRFMRSDISCENDSFLGTSCQVFFKRGSGDDDFNSTISISFGNCQKGMNEGMMRNIEAVYELLINRHKEILAEKIKNADVAAKDYMNYNDYYEKSLEKHNLTTEIPALQDKLDSKMSECNEKQQAYEIAKKAYEDELEVYNTNLGKINLFKNDIDRLNARKEATEQEQIRRRTDKESYETRDNRANGFLNEIQTAIYVILTNVDPNFFNGRNCIVNKVIDTFCLDKLRSIR